MAVPIYFCSLQAKTICAETIVVGKHGVEHHENEEDAHLRDKTNSNVDEENEHQHQYGTIGLLTEGKFSLRRSHKDALDGAKGLQDRQHGDC